MNDQLIADVTPWNGCRQRGGRGERAGRTQGHRTDSRRNVDSTQHVSPNMP